MTKPAGPRRGKGFFAAVGAAIVATGIVVALIADSLSVFTFFAGSDDPQAAPTSIAASRESGSASSTSATPPASSSPASAPICTSSDRKRVDCELPHRFEQFDGECTVAGLVSWLGGRPDVDVVRAGVEPDSGGECRADFRTDVSGSAARALAGENAAALRRCYDGAGDQIVGCDEPHTIEYFAAPVSGIATKAECELAGDTYLGIAPQRRADELRVRRIESSPSGDNARCVIEVVGSQRLASSVRGIETSQLHWVE